MTDIGKEYGAALFMLACETGEKKEVESALKTVLSAFSENPEYAEFLACPGIPLSERLAAIEEAFASALPEHVLSYLQLLCEKGKLAVFSDSAEEYMSLLRASENIMDAKVTSAVELTDEEKKKLRAKLEAFYKGTVNMEYFVDGTLLGGLIVEVGGEIMDGSLRHRLREVKEVISE